MNVPPVANLEEAVYRTVVYAGIFDYALTRAEVRQYLETADIGDEPIEEAIDAALNNGWKLETDGPFLFLAGRRDTVTTRLKRAEQARVLWPWARRYGRIVWALPFVRMVAITGALAVSNVEEDADIDLFLVTEPDRLWLTRAMVIAVGKVARLFGHRLCPNYLISTRCLRLDRQDLYTAHELTQMEPLHGERMLRLFRADNQWYGDFLPNARERVLTSSDDSLPLVVQILRRWGERMLSGHLGDRLERWERDRKIEKLSREGAKSSEAVFNSDICKGHCHGHGDRVLRLLAERISAS